MTHPGRILPPLAAALSLALALGPVGAAAQQSGALSGPLSLTGAAPAAPAGAASAFSPAAFVNDRVVTVYDVDQRERLLALMNLPNSRQDAMTAMIEQNLKRAAAEEAGIEVAAQQVNEGFARFAASGGMDAEGLQRRLSQAGVSRATLRDFVETEIMWTTYVRQRYLARSQVTDLELEDAIANGGLTGATAYDVSEIVIPDRGNPAAARAQAADLARRINEGGEDPAALARRFSASPSAAEGGRIGLMPEDRIPPQFRQVLAGLQPGEATEGLDVPGGVAVLILNDRRAQTAAPTEEARERLRAQLLEERLTRLAEGRLAELRANAFIDQRR